MGTFAGTSIDIENLNQAVDTALVKAQKEIQKAQKSIETEYNKNQSYDFNTLIIVAVLSFALGYSITN